MNSSHGHKLLLRKIQKTLRASNALDGVKKAVIGLSGGPDSSVLLHLMGELRKKGFPEIVAVHIHHGLRDSESDRDSQVAEEWAKQVGCEFHMIPVKPSKGKTTAEHSLREIRQKTLRDCMKKFGAQRILLAHHQNDQAETFLLRLLTGTDIRGLASMKVFRKPYWVRPLLHVTRSEILAEAESCEIPYVHDSSNFQTYPRRNLLRQNIIPLLQTHFNPKLVNHLSDLAGSFGSIYDYLMKGGEQVLQEAEQSTATYNVKPLRQAHPAVRKVALQVAFARFAGEGKALRRVQLTTVENMILTDGEERTFPLPQGVTLVRFNQRFQFIPKP